MGYEHNDIATKNRMMSGLGEELMGYEHNDIVTVDVMNKAIEEGGGGGDFSTAEVTIVNNGSAEYEGHITYITTFPWGDEALDDYLSLAAGNSDTYTCVLYKGESIISVDSLNWSVTVEGDAEFAHNMVTITGNCTITLTDAN